MIRRSQRADRHRRCPARACRYRRATGRPGPGLPWRPVRIRRTAARPTRHGHRGASTTSPACSVTRAAATLSGRGRCRYPDGHLGRRHDRGARWSAPAGPPHRPSRSAPGSARTDARRRLATVRRLWPGRACICRQPPCREHGRQVRRAVRAATGADQHHGVPKYSHSGSIAVCMATTLPKSSHNRWRQSDPGWACWEHRDRPRRPWTRSLGRAGPTLPMSRRTGHPPAA